MDEPLKSKILANLGLLAMQTCMEYGVVDSVALSDIYHVPHAGWQAGELVKWDGCCTVHDAIAFERAVQSPEVRAIFVPHSAEVTQAIARSILLRNSLGKHVFWEAGNAVSDAEPAAPVDDGA